MYYFYEYISMTVMLFLCNHLHAGYMNNSTLFQI